MLSPTPTYTLGHPVIESQFGIRLSVVDDGGDDDDDDDADDGD